MLRKAVERSDIAVVEQPSIQFDAIHVVSISNSSGIFIGTNTQINWSSSSKSNTGLGEVSGEHCIIQNNVSTVYDNDIIDAPYTRGDFIIGRL